MDCQNYTDEELAKLATEQIDLFGCLFERYQKKLLRYILRISSFNGEEAEEVLQESFIKAWTNINEFDDSYKFSSWIYRIVHNTTISQWKKSKSFGKDRKAHVESAVLENHPSHTNLENEAEKRLDEIKMRLLLDKLPEKYKEVLILQFLEEKSYEEITDILQKPMGTIATRISRAKKAFRILAEKEKISFDIN